MPYELIYTSAMIETAHPGWVADIVKSARHFNRRHDITGVLIFDGAHFCQYLEGPREAVLELTARIQSDGRHINFMLKHQGELQTERRFVGYPLAYALDEDGKILEKIMASVEQQTLALLLKSIPNLDSDLP